MLQDMQIVVPEFVLDEESHDRTNGAQEAAGIGHGVDGQVGDDVGTLVVLSHLIARGREEGEQNLVFGMLQADALDDRTSLLELAKRGGMHPHILGVGVDFLFQRLEGSTLAAPQQTDLMVEDGCNGDAQLYEIHRDVVHFEFGFFWFFNYFVITL